MKILVVSDTHGCMTNFDLVIKEEAPFDLLLHLGDSEDCEDYIEAVCDCPVEIIAGNCDRSLHLWRECVFTLRGHTFFMTHGHNYSVKRGMDKLKEAARQRSADVVLFGHTHEPYLMQEGGTLFLNPGSLSFPRPYTSRPSYAVIQMGKDGEIKAELKKL